MRRNTNIPDFSSLPRLERERDLEYIDISFNINKITIEPHLSVDNCKNITNEYKEDLCSLLSRYETQIINEKESINKKKKNMILTINIHKELTLILISIVKFRYIIIILETINTNTNINHSNIIDIIRELYTDNSLEYNTIISSLINTFKRKSLFINDTIQNPNSGEIERKLKYAEYENILEQNFDTPRHFIEYINKDRTKCTEIINKIIYYIKNELSEQYKQLKAYYIDNPQIDINSQDRIITYYFNKYNLSSEIDKINIDFDFVLINRPSTAYYKKYLKYKQKYLKLKQHVNQ
jgi:hypothetical protein